MTKPDTNEVMRSEMTAAFSAKGTEMGQQRWQQGDEHRKAAYESELLIKAFFYGQTEVLLAASASAAALRGQRYAAGPN